MLTSLQMLNQFNMMTFLVNEQPLFILIKWSLCGTYGRFITVTTVSGKKY